MLLHPRAKSDIYLVNKELACSSCLSMGMSYNLHFFLKNPTRSGLNLKLPLAFTAKEFAVMKIVKRIFFQHNPVVSEEQPSSQ